MFDLRGFLLVLCLIAYPSVFLAMDTALLFKRTGLPLFNACLVQAL